MRQIGIRIDDVCPTMDYQKFKAAMMILESYGIKPMLGVVPDCCDPDLVVEKPHNDFWQMIRELQKSGCIIAMHGYQHCYDINKRGSVNDGKKSEFAGHPYDIQFEKIRKGKEILKKQGIVSETFFAPAHSYDANTLRALYANGFRYISDGRSHKAYKQCGVICIPCKFFGLPKMKKDGNYTVVLHPTEWGGDKAEGEKKFTDFCKKYHKEFVSFNELLDQRLGNYIVQKIDEFFYLIYARKIRRLIWNIILRACNGILKMVKK